MLTGASLLECKEFFTAVALVVKLTGRFDQILQVGTCQKVTQVDEFAVVLILNVDYAPSVLATANLLAVDIHCSFTATNGKRNNRLRACQPIQLLQIIWCSERVARRDIP